MTDQTIRGRTAIAGLGETRYYKRGAAPDPEFKMTLDAIKLAADDAGIDVRDIDGFASFSNDRNDPAHIAAALGTKSVGFSNMFWGGGGGGGSGAVAMQRRRWPRAIAISQWRTEGWLKANSAALARAARRARSRGLRRSLIHTA